MRIDGLRLSRRAGGGKILDRVYFSARAGEMVGILGPSGSGKSTLLSALSGYRRADEGCVYIEGKDLYADLSSMRGRFGFVPQEDLVHRTLTVSRALSYAALLRMGAVTGEAERSRRIGEVLRLLELDDRKKSRIHRLSGGERKRVSIGVELLTRPSLLFLDEPTTGLDPALEKKFMELFRTLAGEGRSVILSTHVMSSIELLDRLLFLVRGRMAFYGPPRSALQFFEVADYASIYPRLSERKPEEWAELYAASPWCREDLEVRFAELKDLVEKNK